MNAKSPNDFNGICWELAKNYFSAMDREHIARMIEHTANKQIDERQLDSQKFERTRPIGG